MKITFLGSGGAFCDFRVNYQNNVLVETEDGPVLIDCGVTACQSLRELEIPHHSIRAVLFTHLHADHASPEQLLFSRYYDGPGNQPGFQQTELVAPDAVLEPLLRSLHPYLDEYTDARGDYARGGLQTLVQPRPTQEVEIGGVRFRWFRVPHITGGPVDKAAYGIEIDDGRRRVFWSGDTTLSLPWIDRAAAADRCSRIFHECLFFAPYRGTVHTHFSQLVELPEELLSRVTLMHHTAVPEGVELGALRGAARRHEIFEL